MAAAAQLSSESVQGGTPAPCPSETIAAAEATNKQSANFWQKIFMVTTLTDDFKHTEHIKPTSRTNSSEELEVKALYHARKTDEQRKRTLDKAIFLADSNI